MPKAGPEMRVSQLTIYPIKGCKGIDVTSAACYGTGLQYDRQWMVVLADTGKFVSQRQIPKLCQVAISLPPEVLLGPEWGQLQPGTAMVLSAPDMTPLHVPLQTGNATAQSIRHVSVWEWSGPAADEGDEAADWFSKFLNKQVRLVRCLHGTPVPNSRRQTDPEFAAGHEVQFADGFPILAITEESLAALNSHLGEQLPMNRFRPNIVMSGAPAPWVDDKWRLISIGSGGGQTNGQTTGQSNSQINGQLRASVGRGAVLQYVKPCSRCNVTTVNQDTAAVGKEPLKTLGQIRSGKVLGWADQHRSWTNAVFFGWNAAVRQQGRIAVGDPVQLLEAAAPQAVQHW